MVGIVAGLSKSMAMLAGKLPCKVLVVHIGMHKTGTTSIQNTLYRFDDGQTRFLSIGDFSNHSVPIFSIYSEDTSQYFPLTSQGMEHVQVEHLISQWKGQLHSELKNYRRRTLIMSGEDIGLLTDQEKTNLVSDLQKRVRSIKVIMYARSPLDFVVSAVQERIKNGNFKSIQYPIKVGYALRAGAFLSLLGKENVEIFDYGRCCYSAGGVVDHFTRVAGISAPIKSQRENLGLSAPATKILFAVNRLDLRLDRVTQNEVSRELSMIYKDAERLAHSAFEASFTVSKEDVSLLAQYDIEVEEAQASKSGVKALEHYLTDLRSIDFEPVRSWLSAKGFSTSGLDEMQLISEFCKAIAHRGVSK